MTALQKKYCTWSRVLSSRFNADVSFTTVNKLYEFSAPKKVSELIISHADIQLVTTSLNYAELNNRKQ